MLHPERLLSLLTWISVVAVAAPACDDAADGAGGAGAGHAGGQAGEAPLPPASPKALVKFKSAERLQRELGRVLKISPEEVCKELGKFDCFGIHAASLLEADPSAGLFEPLAESTVTSPVAVDRIVLSACVFATDRAAKRALGDEPPIDPDGSTFMQSVSDRYAEAMGRLPREEELAAHRELAVSITKSGGTPREVRILSCYATLTSLEFLFY